MHIFEIVAGATVDLAASGIDWLKVPRNRGRIVGLIGWELASDAAIEFLSGGTATGPLLTRAARRIAKVMGTGLDSLEVVHRLVRSIGRAFGHADDGAALVRRLDGVRDAAHGAGAAGDAAGVGHIVPATPAHPGAQAAIPTPLAPPLHPGVQPATPTPITPPTPATPATPATPSGNTTSLPIVAAPGQVLHSCFTAGTPLLTPDGEKPIEQFRPGDEILSRSEHDLEGPIAIKLVEETFIRTAAVMSLQARGKEINTTSEHPFFVRAKAWICAKEVEVGDEMLSHDGQWITIEAIKKRNDVATVYNLRVSDYHTYFVGSRTWGFSVWAHNADYVPRQLAPELGGGWVVDIVEDGVVVGQARMPGQPNRIQMYTGSNAEDLARTRAAELRAAATPAVVPGTTAEITNLIADSNPAFPLSETNAIAALDGPPGTNRVVKGPSGAGADIEFKDALGNTVFSREIKAIEGEWRTIDSHFSKACKQIGKGNAGDIFFQIPNTTTTTEAGAIARRLAGLRAAKKEDYARMTLTIVNQNGVILHHGPAVP